MSGLKARIRGNTIYAEGHIEGVRVQKSTGLKKGADKKRVDTVLMNIYYEEVAKIKGKRPPDGGRSSYRVESNSGPTLKEVYELYVTRATYMDNSNKYMAERWVKFIGGERKLTELTPLELEKIRRQAFYVEGKPRVADATQHKQLNVLQGMINHGRRLHSLEKLTIEKPSGESPEVISYWEEDDIWKVLEAAKGSCIEPLFQLCLLMGARTKEAMTLEWRHVTLRGPDDSELILHSRKRRNGELKGRQLEMPEPVYECLTRYAQVYGQEGRVIRQEDGKPWWLPADHDAHGGAVTTGVRNRYKEILRKAGVKYIRPYDMRHTFATRMKNLRCDQDELQRFLGHSTPAMTQRYAHLTPDRKRSIIRGLSKPIKADSDGS